MVLSVVLVVLVLAEGAVGGELLPSSSDFSRSCDDLAITTFQFLAKSRSTWQPAPRNADVCRHCTDLTVYH